MEGIERRLASMGGALTLIMLLMSAQCARDYGRDFGSFGSTPEQARALVGIQEQLVMLNATLARQQAVDECATEEADP